MAQNGFTEELERANQLVDWPDRGQSQVGEVRQMAAVDLAKIEPMLATNARTFSRPGWIFEFNGTDHPTRRLLETV